MSLSSRLTWREYVELLWINLKVKAFNLMEYLRVVFYYYRDPLFRKLDGSLLRSYLFESPFQLSKAFLKARGEEDVYTYGETPLTTLNDMAQRCRLSAQDVVFELGCGRGRTCFWLNRFIGCRSIGIDYVPAFIERAKQVKKQFDVQGVEFRLENFLQSDFKTATVIYLYGTCYEASFIKQLISRFKSLPPGTHFITISYALTDYQTEPLFEVQDSFPARFTWGMADVYWQVLR